VNLTLKMVSSMEVSMRNDSTVFVALDVHQKSIVGAYAVDAGEVQDLGSIGILQRDLDRLCQRMQAKGSRVRFVYEAGPCGYAVYRYLTGKGFDCTVCAPSKIARKPGDRVKTDQRDARKLVQALRTGDLSRSGQSVGRRAAGSRQGQAATQVLPAGARCALRRHRQLE
jgi:transposase